MKREKVLDPSKLKEIQKEVENKNIAQAVQDLAGGLRIRMEETYETAKAKKIMEAAMEAGLEVDEPEAEWLRRKDKNEQKTFIVEEKLPLKPPFCLCTLQLLGDFFLFNTSTFFTIFMFRLPRV